MDPREEDQRRQDERLESLQVMQLREDVRSVLSDATARRLVWVFIEAMDVDVSAFNTNAMAQSRKIGRQEAGQWWLRAIRDNCPEREAQMRAEANSLMKRLQSQLQQTEESDDE
ncbi:hypothetical protein ROW33_09300 [Stenotrophomonas maltophilia]|uniref:hypothetical protein n=1 Tax=Stenotrophomonas maltophilia TaxID=40324 RepID=UPI002894D40F|nr:hypothetical protein [Stenotrophomonas maltophilia]MDT3448862.1 hypothetical protein [Stenotrophomonas maltophilia]